MLGHVYTYISTESTEKKLREGMDDTFTSLHKRNHELGIFKKLEEKLYKYRRTIT